MRIDRTTAREEYPDDDKCARQGGPITQSMQTLHEQVELLQKETATLASVLTPILVPTESASGEGDKMGPNVPPLADQLNGFSLKIERAIRTLSDLRARIGL